LDINIVLVIFIIVTTSVFFTVNALGIIYV